LLLPPYMALPSRPARAGRVITRLSWRSAHGATLTGMTIDRVFPACESTETVARVLAKGKMDSGLRRDDEQNPCRARQSEAAGEQERRSADRRIREARVSSATAGCVRPAPRVFPRCFR